LAASRLANYLTMLQDVFGSHLLKRPIQLVDLSVEERQLQRGGLYQLFKFRDHSDRRIMGCFESQYDPASTFQSQVRKEQEWNNFLKGYVLSFIPRNCSGVEGFVC
jgi:hypothetical protein